MVFSPDLLTDSNWAYLQSQGVRPEIQDDANPGGGQAVAAMGAQVGGLYRGGAQPGGSQAQRGGQPQGGKHAEKEVFDRL